MKLERSLNLFLCLILLLTRNILNEGNISLENGIASMHVWMCHIIPKLQ